MYLKQKFYRIVFLAFAFFEVCWGFYMSSFRLYDDPNDGLVLRLIISLISLGFVAFTYNEKLFSKYGDILISICSYFLCLQQLYFTYQHPDNYLILFATMPPILTGLLFIPNKINLIILTSLVNLLSLFIPQENLYFSINLFTYSSIFFIFKYFFINYTEKVMIQSNKILRNHKLVSLGEFTKGMSHEFNNLQTRMTLLIDLIKISEEKDLKTIEKLENELLSLTRFSKKLDPFSCDQTNKETLNLYNLKEIIYKVSTSINIKLKDYFINSKILLSLDKDMITNVFENIVYNAIQAKADKISFVLMEDSENQMLSIFIKNNGDMIPKENVEKIFNPFFSTKDISKHLGLGLSSSQKMLHNNNGDIELIESNEKATTFKITLPIKNENL